ncbi:hypothetical protein MTO96_045246 [Rhipicephalus appendiculatus]
MRGDKELDETCVVCSRHFDDRYAQRTFKHVINGEVVEIDRERPALTDDAVPTIFPDAPSYLTKALPRKRKERSIADCETPSAKRLQGRTMWHLKTSETKASVMTQRLHHCIHFNR